jgi:hypothetical protein
VSGVPFVVGTVLIGYLAYLCVAHLPEVFWSYGRSGSSLSATGAQHFALGPKRKR